MKNDVVWEVEIRSREWVNERYTYHVIASNAAGAERKGIMLARKEPVDKPYCRSTALLCSIDG